MNNPLLEILLRIVDQYILSKNVWINYLKKESFVRNVRKKRAVVKSVAKNNPCSQ